MQLLKMWALPLVVMTFTLLVGALKGSFILGFPFLLLLVWLGYALFRTRSHVGMVISGITIVSISVSALWVVRNPAFIETYFIGRISTKILAETSEAGWQEKKVGPFQLRYRENDAGVADVELALTGARARVVNFFSEVPKETVVVVYPELIDLEAAVEEDLPDWGIGGGFGAMMAVTSPTIWSAKTLASSTVEQIVTHEYTHVVVNQLSGNRAPKWLNEGVAPIVAGQFAPSSKSKVIEKFAEGGLYSLAEVDQFFRHPAAHPDQNAGLMYAEAASVVSYIIKKYGAEKLIQVLVELGSGKTPRSALQLVLGFDQAGLEAAWQKSM